MNEMRLEQRWRDVLNAGSGLFNLVDSDHPLRIYIGGNSDGKPTLTLLLTERPPPLATFDSLSIDLRRRDDGTWLLLLQLESSRAFREFVTMCGDLIVASRSAANETGGLSAFLTALEHWRNLFKPAVSALLTEAELRGLVAELVCMKDLFRPSRSWEDIVHGWVGPVAAPQDFRLSAATLVEAKAIHRDSSAVQISSLEQLDAGISSMYLATVVVEREIPDAANAVTVPELARAIETELVGSFELVDELRAKLREIQFDAADPGYEEYWFSVGQLSLYVIGADFPRLIRSNVPSDVARAEYQLALSALQRFAVDPRQIFAGG